MGEMDERNGRFDGERGRKASRWGRFLIKSPRLLEKIFNLTVFLFYSVAPFREH